jgi:hypothetical protein
MGHHNNAKKSRHAKDVATATQYVEQDTVVNEDWRLRAVTAFSRDSRSGARQS